MGRVFAFKDIVGIEVPQLEDFFRVKREVGIALTYCDAVIAGAFCGSILKPKDISIRSDIDLVVIYKYSQRETVIKILQDQAMFADSLNVPLELILVDDQLARAGGHGIYLSFYEHLAFSKERNGIIKSDPREIIKPENEIVEETIIYTAQKRSALEKRLTLLKIEGKEKYFYLTKFLEAPIYVARKIVRCFDSKILSESDSKTAVFEEYNRLFPRTEQLRILRIIEDVNKRYSRELDAQLKDPNETIYNAVIQEIIDCAPSVLDFLRINIGIAKRLSQGLKTAKVI